MMTEEDLKLDDLAKQLAEVTNKCLAVAQLYLESWDYLSRLRAVAAAAREVVKVSTQEAYPGQEVDIVQVLPTLETALNALAMSEKGGD